MEIVQERLEREFNMTVITTVPNVSYIAHKTNGEVIHMNNPSDMPDPSTLDFIEEPFIKSNIIYKRGREKKNFFLYMLTVWNNFEKQIVLTVARYSNSKISTPHGLS